MICDVQFQEYQQTDTSVWPSATVNVWHKQSAYKQPTKEPCFVQRMIVLYFMSCLFFFYTIECINVGYVHEAEGDWDICNLLNTTVNLWLWRFMYKSFYHRDRVRFVLSIVHCTQILWLYNLMFYKYVYEFLFLMTQYIEIPDEMRWWRKYSVSIK